MTAFNTSVSNPTNQLWGWRYGSEGGGRRNPVDPVNPAIKQEDEEVDNTADGRGLSFGEKKCLLSELPEKNVRVKLGDFLLQLWSEFVQLVQTAPGLDLSMDTTDTGYHQVETEVLIQLRKGISVAVVKTACVQLAEVADGLQLLQLLFQFSTCLFVLVTIASQVVFSEYHMVFLGLQP